MRTQFMAEDFKTEIAAARGAVAAARELREELRWSVAKDDPERVVRITETLRIFRDVMVPIRSAIGRVAGGWLSASDSMYAELRAVSAAVQYERKQLKKMLP